MMQHYYVLYTYMVNTNQNMLNTLRQSVQSPNCQQLVHPLATSPMAGENYRQRLAEWKAFTANGRVCPPAALPYSDPSMSWSCTCLFAALALALAALTSWGLAADDDLGPEPFIVNVTGIPCVQEMEE